MALKKVVKNDQSGQALVEYVLILAITVMLFLGLMNQFYKPFGDWMKDYMGAYLECLIDIGELPALGFDGGSGECSLSIKGGSRGGGNGSPGGRNNDPSKTAKNQKSNSDSDNSSGGGGSGGSSRRNSADTRGFQVGGPKGADGPGSASAASGSMSERLPESQFFKSRGKPYAINTSANKSPINGISGVITVEANKSKKRESKPFSSVRAEDEFGSESQKAKKLIVKPGERKPASQSEDSSWSFSEYLKFGLIIAIIIALVLFIGGQILQISKSMEK